MIGNVIVVLTVCCAVFYLYRHWKKISDPDSLSCGGCAGCQDSKKSNQNTILNSMEDAEKKEK